MSTITLLPLLVTVLGCLDGSGAHDAPSVWSATPQAMFAEWDAAMPLRREAILKSLTGSAKAFDTLVLEALRSGTVNERLLACALLERAGGAEAVAALTDAIGSADERVAAQATLSLSRIGDPSPAPAIRAKLAASSSPRLIKAALAALGRVGDTTDLVRIAPYLSDTDESVRVNAAAALAQLGDTSGEAILLAATLSANPQARREATYALGFLESAESLARLETIASGPSERWRTEADAALVVRGNAGKHLTEVHGGGVDGDPRRSMTANAFELLDSSFYSARDASDTARGTVDEDIGARPINHFYNPMTGLNTMPASRMDAVVRAEEFWSRALTLWRTGMRNGNLGATKMLGRSLHLLQDMTSPAHIHDDPHVPPLDPDDFENWGPAHYPTPEEMLPGLAPFVPEGVIPLPDGRTVSASSPAGLVHGMAIFTYEMTAIPGEIVAGATQPDSELARMFPDGRLYYQDAGILGANYWQIDDVGPFGLLEENAWWPCAGDFVDTDPGEGAAQRISGRFYIENVSGDHGELAPAVYERPLRHIADPAGLSFLQIYAGELYPEAVERSAGFLAAFQTAAAAPGGCTAPTSGSAKTTAGDSLLTALAAGILILAGRKKPR